MDSRDFILENGHRNSGFTHWKWRFSIVMLICQRVSCGKRTQMFTAWWFGTWILFFQTIGNFIIPTDELIFFRGWNHQPVYIGKWWFNQSQMRTMVVYLPTKLDVWGKCWDSYSSTMVRIWEWNIWNGMEWTGVKKDLRLQYLSWNPMVCWWNPMKCCCFFPPICWCMISRSGVPSSK